MKKANFLSILVGFCFMILIPIVSFSITLRLTDQNSEKSWGSVHAVQPWAKQVEKATKGRVKIQIYSSQTLSKGPTNWKAVRTGIADICWCFHGYWAGMTPLADVISLPALPYSAAEKGSEVLWKLYEKFPEIQKQFAANKVLLTWTSTPYILITRNKQVKTLEDIKGMKIRMTGGPPTAQMKALGGIPVSIRMPDNYMSLEKGVIDGMGAPWEAIHGFRLYEVVKYYTQVPFPAVYFTISMNKNVWNKLSKEDQDAIMSVSGLPGSKFFGRNFFDTAKDGVMNKPGINIIYNSLSQTEHQRWLEIGGKPIWKDWVKKSKNPQLAQRILDETLRLLE